MLLRDELGIAPGAAVRALHARLLLDSDAAPFREEVPARPAPPPDPPDPAAAREERKRVTVLAADLDTASDVNDPEDVRVQHEQAAGRARRHVDHLGGWADDSTAGSLVVVFGVPIAHEDDAERAVLAGALLTERGLVGRAGIATGDVLVEGSAGARPKVSGRPLAEAARRAREAPAAAVVVDAATAQIAGAAAAYDELGPGTWLVRAPREPVVEARPVRRTRFIGRTRELDSLAGVYRTVVEERQPRAVTVVGQAGVGKTRLAEEFLARTRVGAVHRGRCLAYGQGITYWALREVLWSVTGIRLDDAGGVVAAKLRDGVRGVVEDVTQAERVTAALALSAGIAMPRNPLERQSPTTVADEIELAWPAFMHGLTRAQPTVILIEDVHWAEPSLLAMLERIVARSDGSLVLLVTARPEIAERAPSWGSRPRMEQIALEPLSREASEAMVRELLPDAATTVTERVVARGDGNPFFLEELVRDLGDDADEAPGNATVPETVRALLASRIDALPDDQKHVLQDAAVVGRTFWTSAVESIGARESVRATLDGLEQRGLVVTRNQSSLPGHVELSFAHALTREVAYASLSRRARAIAHAAVGRWLESLAGERRDEFIDLLAYHFETASSPADAELAWPGDSAARDALRSKAVHALLDGGHAARRRLSLDAALQYAERADALRTGDAERLAVLVLRARTHHAALNGDEAVASYTAGVELARQLGDHVTESQLRAQATLLAARYAGTVSDDDRRARLVDLARTDDADLDDAATFEVAARLVGRGWGRWASTSAEGREDARRDLERAVEIAEELDDPELLGAALEGLTWRVLEGGFSSGAEMGERLYLGSQRSSDHVEAHENIITAALCFAWAGDFARAVRAAHEATALSARLTSHRRLHSAAAASVCFAPTGRFRELGEATARVAEDAGEEGTNACGTVIVGIAGRALWQFEAGDVDGARRSLELLEAVRPDSWLSLFQSATLDLLRPMLSGEEALAMVDRLEAPRDHGAEAVLDCRARLQVLAMAGPPDDLAGLIEESRALARSASAPALGWIADWAAAVALVRAGRPEAMDAAIDATGALRRYGETYTALRLLADALVCVEDDRDERLGARTAAALEQLGAGGSAAQLRSARVGRR